MKSAKKAPNPPKMAAPVLDAEKIISALYRALLLREPDEPGLKTQTAKFVSEGFDIERAVSSILSSSEFSGKAWNVLSKYVGYDRMRFTNDKSQHGETLALIRHLVIEGSKHQIVVDIGARGVDRSNSYDLMKHFGWKGLLVEANPNLIPEIAKGFSGLQFKLVHCAVSDYTGEADFFFGVNNDVSSLTRQTSEKWGEVQGATKVQVRQLVDVLEENSIPSDFDVLSLDIEGEDIKVFNDLIDNSAYRPRLVLIEVPPRTTITSLGEFLFSDGVKQAYDLLESIGPNLLLKFRAGQPECAGPASREL